jgi:hypothetical protein
MTVVYHVPRAIPRLDETIICPSEGGIAKNVAMKNRIHPVQAARFYKPTLIAGVVEIRPSWRSAEKAQSSGDCNRDESLLSIHKQPPFVSLTPLLSSGGGPRRCHA